MLVNRLLRTSNRPCDLFMMTDGREQFVLWGNLEFRNVMDANIKVFYGIIHSCVVL